MKLMKRLILGRTARFTDVMAYKNFFVLNLLALGGAVLFAAFGVYYLIALNNPLFFWMQMGGTVLCLVGFVANRRGVRMWPMIVLTLVLAGLCVFWSWMLGWMGGVLWFMLAGVIPHFIITETKRHQRLVMTILCFLLFNVCVGLCLFSVPQFIMSAQFQYMHTVIISNGVFITVVFEMVLAYLANTYVERSYLHAMEEERERSMRDPLTGLWNRRYLEQMEVNENIKGALAVIDIDHFRDVNDTYSHEVGDRLLIHLTQLMVQSFRRSDTLVRWGGEEFLLIFYDAPFPRAIELLDNFRNTAAETPLVLADKTEIKFTFSGGLCQLPHGASIPETAERANEHMIRAKAEGRNRIVADEVVTLTQLEPAAE